MKHTKVFGLSLLAVALFFGCQKTSDSPQDKPVNVAGAAGSVSMMTTPDASVDAAAGQPGDEIVRKGERGSSCNSSNDCEPELSCIATHDCPTGVACSNKSCQPSNFNLTGTGKSCHVRDCSTKADCCGDKPLVTPAKCANRQSICNQPTLAGCTATNCTSSATCGKGKCEGKCYLDNVTCLTTANCAANTCDTALNPDTCTVSKYDCSLSTCTVNTCSTPYCNCKNPEYLPTDPICTDPDCDGICAFTCTDDRCVADTGCTADSQCAVSKPFCTMGVCGECRTKDDCKDEDCIDGHCGPACTSDTQCGLFEACQTGKCVYVGCRSDRECVLKASSANSAQGQDPRLSKCSVEGNLGTCVFPCEIDAQCAATEVCFEGVCKYIGCERDSECATIAGLHNLPAPTPDRPWITSAICVAEDSATP